MPRDDRPDGPRRPRPATGSGRQGGAPPPRGREDRRPPPRRPRVPKPAIVERSEGVLVVEKPPGMPVRGDDALTLRECVLSLGFARRQRMKPWHTIDAGASGAVAFVTGEDRPDLVPPDARPEVAYLALVEGAFDDEIARSGTTINAPVAGDERRGSTPVTHLRVVDSGNGISLLQVRARPDLPGQIPQHLGAIGHPVLGDPSTPGVRDDLGRLALHAYELRYRDLESGSFQRVRVPAPRAWWSLLGTEPPSGMSRDDASPATDAEGWDNVAGWYDDLLSTRGSDHHERVVLPGVERLVALAPGERLLDVACGTGAAARHLIGAQPGATALGVDLSSELIELARSASPESIDYAQCDARELGTLKLSGFDAAVCVLALMNIDPIAPVFAGIASSLKNGGRLVGVILHPSFRRTGASAWGWARDERDGHLVQFRRVDRYMSEARASIVMNPGAVAKGAGAITTTTHHRPIGLYVEALCRAGLTVNAIEEWVSERRSEPGPRADAENLARREIPMFLAFRAVKACPPSPG